MKRGQGGGVHYHASLVSHYTCQTTDTHLGGGKERKRREEGCTDSYSLVPTSCASVGSDGNRSSTQTYTSVVQLKCSKVVFTSEESSLTVSNQCLHCTMLEMCTAESLVRRLV